MDPISNINVYIALTVITGRYFSDVIIVKTFFLSKLDVKKEEIIRIQYVADGCRQQPLAVMTDGVRIRIIRRCNVSFVRHWPSADCANTEIRLLAVQRCSLANMQFNVVYISGLCITKFCVSVVE